jgi:hypothetical protein
LRSASRFKKNIPKWEGPDEAQINIQSTEVMKQGARKVWKDFKGGSSQKVCEIPNQDVT